MKKTVLSIMAVFVIIIYFPNLVMGETEQASAAVVATSLVATVDASVLTARVEAIKAMDFSALNASERKELRKELRTIKTDLKKSNTRDEYATHGNGGIYLSVGAIILIVVLLLVVL